MSELIAARAKGELLERYEDEKDGLGEDETESELVRDLLDRGLRERRVPLVARLDLSNRVGAQIEAAREPGESEREVVRRFLTEAVDARDRDTLDELGVGEDAPLRAAVRDAQEEGEPLDDTVRRLVRDGAEGGDSARERAPSAVIPATIAATLAVSVSLLMTGENYIGGVLAFFSGGALAVWGLAQLAGWDTAFRGAVAEVREGYREIGGLRGFFRYAWERWEGEHPVQEPTTPIERVARFDLYVPFLLLVAVAVTGVAWSVVEAGLLSAIAPPGALLLLLAVIAALYSVPLAVFVAGLATLAVSSSDSGDVDSEGVAE